MSHSCKQGSDIFYASFKMLDMEPEEMHLEICAAGFDGYEIISKGRHDISKKDNRKKYKNFKNDTSMKLTVHAPFEGLNLASLNDDEWDESIDKISKCIKGASEIGSPHITIHPGFISKVSEYFPSEAWEKNLEAFKQLAEVAEDYDIKIGIENMPSMPHLLCKRPSELLGLVDSVGSDNVGMVLDVGHANTNGNLDRFLELSRNISMVHLHDNQGVHDSHLMIGEGNIDFRKVFSFLEDYNGPFVIEGRNISEGKSSRIKIAKMLI